MRNSKYFLLVTIFPNLIIFGCNGNGSNGPGTDVPGGGNPRIESIALPQTGQTTCKDEAGTTIDCAGTGQDGELRTGVSWPDPRFTIDATSNCITDNLTGLTWVREHPDGAFTWQAALDYANNLDLCGATDWRLPNRKELRSLINAGTYSLPWLSEQGFLNINPGDYWTSSTVAGSPAEAWMMIAINGTVYPEGKSAQNVLWPVRGGL